MLRAAMGYERLMKATCGGPRGVRIPRNGQNRPIASIRMCGASADVSSMRSTVIARSSGPVVYLISTSRSEASGHLNVIFTHASKRLATTANCFG